MVVCQVLCLVVWLGIAVAANNETYDASKPIVDRFRMIQNNVNEQSVMDHVEEFTSYGCEKMVVIRNRAHEAFMVSCKSHYDSTKTVKIEPGNAFTFTFRPRKTGDSVYWCNVEYKQQFARFYVYNEQLSYMCPRDIDEVYQYTVHHDGVYVDPAKGNEGQKIRSLFKGHNKFILWEEFHNNETDGFLISGLVDGGSCYDIPDQFNDRTAAVTICYNHCVHLYEHYGCRGKVQTVQAMDQCVDVELTEELLGKLSALKGC